MYIIVGIIAYYKCIILLVQACRGCAYLGVVELVLDAIVEFLRIGFYTTEIDAKRHTKHV